ncbi:hypothetical protein AB1L88_26380 [Tautonia sp. JC769]|uniref:TolB family protein n=1 Tax=Tautonia sp. JC769 TaxID=3232135 RepID=UPI003458B57D
MITSFGPWSSGIDSHSCPHLSTFWKRRMAMLPCLAKDSGAPTRRQVLHAGLLSLGLAAWPTLRPGRAVEPGAVPGQDDKAKGMLYVHAIFTLITQEELERGEGAERGGIVALDPESGEWRMAHPRNLDVFSISPDGTRLAFGDHETRDGYLRLTNVKIAEFGRPDAPVETVCEFGDWAVWSGDGSELIVPLLTTELGKDPRRWEHWRMNADGTNRVKLPIPESHCIMAWSPDGQWIATASPDHPDARGNHVYIIRPDGSGLRRMSDEDISAHASFSPDSRRLAFVERRSIVTVNLDGTDRRSFTPAEESAGSYTDTAWSPDGRSVACTAMNFDRDPEVRRNQEPDYRILIIDTEDGAARTLRVPGALFLSRLYWLSG